MFVQFFLAGLGVFGAESFEAHKDFAGGFHLFALLLVILALLVRRNRVDLILVITLFVLTTIQFSLPEAATATVAAAPRPERAADLHRRLPRAARGIESVRASRGGTQGLAVASRDSPRADGCRAADRARRGASGALYPQSALAGLNSRPRVRPSGPVRRARR